MIKAQIVTWFCFPFQKKMILNILTLDEICFHFRFFLCIAQKLKLRNTIFNPLTTATCQQ